MHIKSLNERIATQEQKGMTRNLDPWSDASAVKKDTTGTEIKGNELSKRAVTSPDNSIQSLRHRL